jgi:hypothetical protein
MEKIVRIIVVRVFRSSRHNSGYDLGNSRVAASAPNTVRYRRAPSDSFDNTPTLSAYGRSSSETVGSWPHMIDIIGSWSDTVEPVRMRSHNPAIFGQEQRIMAPIMAEKASFSRHYRELFTSVPALWDVMRK